MFLVNSEGMEDRYYFSDWGGCICSESGDMDPDCPLFDGDEHEDE
jgi:hypothetical protein